MPAFATLPTHTCARTHAWLLFVYTPFHRLLRCVLHILPLAPSFAWFGYAHFTGRFTFLPHRLPCLYLLDRTLVLRARPNNHASPPLTAAVHATPRARNWSRSLRGAHASAFMEYQPCRHLTAPTFPTGYRTPPHAHYLLLHYVPETLQVELVAERRGGLRCALRRYRLRARAWQVGGFLRSF